MIELIYRNGRHTGCLYILLYYISQYNKHLHFFVINYTGGFRRQLPDGVKWDTTLERPAKMWNEVTRVIPLEKPRTELLEHVKATVETTHWHEHTYTCKKGGRRGDHFDCRMDYDRPLVPKTVLIDDGMFAVKREHGMLTPYVPGLQLACPANHTMQLTCEVTRWLRKHLLFQDAQSRTLTKVSDFYRLWRLLAC